MPMADDFVNDPDPDRQIDSTLIKLAEQYASCDRRSADINEERQTIRSNSEKLGIPSKAFQHAVGMVKHMTDGERRDYQVGVNRVLKAISDRQNDLFPVEAERNRKREDKRAAENQPKTREEVDANADANPRSDPASGGAGRPSEEDLSKAAAAVDPEQAEGDAALKAGLPKTRKAQSAVAKEKLEAAKLN